MDSIFYNFGDPEIKDPLGPKLALNAINCDGIQFSYSTNILAVRSIDKSNVIITNFVTAVNGGTTSDDYLSITTNNYKDSPYIATVTINLTLTG